MNLSVKPLAHFGSTVVYRNSSVVVNMHQSPGLVKESSGK